MHYIIDYDIVALIVAFTVIISFSRKKTLNTKLTRIFSILSLNIIISTILDLITVYTIANSTTIPLWTNYLVNILFFICLTFVPVTFFFCIKSAIEEKRKNYQPIKTIYLLIPYIVEFLIIASTPLTKSIFYFDINFIYKHGFLYWIELVISFFYMAMCSITAYRNHFYLSKSQISTVIFYTIASLLTLYLQLILPNLLAINFIAALSALLLFLSLENPSNYKDKEMDIFNRSAFLLVVNQKLLYKKSFKIIGFQIYGLKYLNETIGLSHKNELMKNSSDLLKIACGKNFIFRLSGSKLAVIIPNDEKKEKQIIERIKLVFSEPFRIESFKLSLSVRLSSLSCPENATTVEDAIDIIEYSLQSIADKEAGELIKADKKILKNIEREHAIQILLKKAILSNDFYVVYQPIFSLEENRFVTAEALIRLKENPELGYIGPDEFIPIAEKNGLILQIGVFVFRSVCEFIAREKIWEKGLKYIHINLSVIQCMQDKLHEQLLKIMDEFNLEYKYINLEVTETAAIASSETLKGNMSKLISHNINFALDDFGSGFSNMATLIEYPFQVIKLDKTIIQTSMKNEKAKKILENIIKMVKLLKMTIISEGVETKEQVDALAKMGCNFIQGYYYSKPLDEKSFVELLK